ncbi:MAG: hypothetical protein ACI8T1_002529 [Verrucomicrobiales bacterium]|jgi:hypothetical protein
MNADRLNALLHVLRDDFNRTKLPQRIEKLSNALQQLVQQPQQPNHQTAVSNALKEVHQALGESEIDSLSPAWKEMLSEIGYATSLGNAASERLNESFKQADVTPTIVKEETDVLKDEITRLNDAVTKGISAFEGLSVGAEELDPGECELGFMVPKEAIEYRLDSFANECREFDFIFGTFSEVVTGHRDHYRISTISSSDLSVFLDSAPAVAALVATAAERIVAFYKQLLEVRKLRSEMLKQDVPKDAFKAIDEHSNSKMGIAIDEIASKIMAEHGDRHESGRKNELENSLRISLQKLANRIDRGYHIEVRIGLLPEPEEEGEEVDEELKANADAIHKASKPLEFIRLEGDPILSLPEVEEESPPKQGAKKAPRKKG